MSYPRLLTYTCNSIFNHLNFILHNNTFLLSILMSWRQFMKVISSLLWTSVAVLFAIAFAMVTGIFNPQEHINALWLVVAAGCFFTLAYRFYGAFLAAKVLSLDDRRITPAFRLNDGKNFYPTNKWVLFGHHFAAIAGAGPLIGPVLAAQFGYLPGFLWILIGAVLAGGVHDFVILVASIRRDGKSLTQIAKEEVGPLTGGAALARYPLYFDRCHGRVRPCGHKRSFPKPVGHLYYRHDHSDCFFHGDLHEIPETK